MKYVLICIVLMIVVIALQNEELRLQNKVIIQQNEVLQGFLEINMDDYCFEIQPRESQED